ncbi:MAG: BON domain-containing protein [Fuerstiella sp.]|nr:BON domain-containing protein [Fuerstiella sp.]
MRKYGKWLLVLGILAATPAWAGAQGVANGTSPRTAMQQQNQRVAEHISAALRQARLNGYDINIVVRGGSVKLDGKVRDVTHRALATRVCEQVRGINSVQNNLRFVPGGAIQQTGGTANDSGVRWATFESNGDGNTVQQIHFQKPGKRRSSKSTTRATQPQQTPRPPRIQFETKSQPAPLPKPVAVGKPEAFQPAPLPVQQPKSVTVSKPEAFAEPAPLIVQQPEAVAVSKPEAFPEPAPAPPSVQADVEIPALEKSVSPPSTPVASATASYPQTLPVEIAEVSTASSVQQEVLESNTALKPLLVRKTQSDNQRTAQQVADALQRVGLTGYEIEIRFEDGIAALAGEVATVEQLQAARIAASTVQGVNEVQNRLQVTEPIAQTNFVPRRGPVPPVSQASMAMMAGMQATPTSIGGAGAYSNPQLPKHAWPAYAQYPNSAAVSYPTQYSASAWPYIGPFYPYPQVPMGWREVSLEWDDGHWQLDFEKKKDAWYWLFKPKNWK